MKKTTLFIVLILIFALVLGGCSNGPDGESQEVDSIENEEIDDVENEEIDNEEEQEAEIEEETEESSDETDSSSPFSKINNMNEYYYEIETTSSDGTLFTSKLWFSGNKTRMESYYPETEEETIMIIDGEEGVSYIYMPAENMAIKMDYEDSPQMPEAGEQQSANDYIDLMKDMADNEDVTVENGTFEGEPVKIISGEIMGNTNKIWVSTNTGFPLKSEFYMDGKLDSTTLFKGFENKSIDPSIFTIPEGIEIMDMTGN